jgi:hypothetical protein
MAYTKKVIEHYENPRNVGSLDTLSTGTIYFTSSFLKKKSLFTDQSGEKEDRRVRTITPTVMSTSISFDTEGRLNWHTDSCAAPDISDIPHYTSLFCIQNNEKVPTRFLTAKQIWEALDPASRTILST